MTFRGRIALVFWPCVVALITFFLAFVFHIHGVGAGFQPLGWTIAAARKAMPFLGWPGGLSGWLIILAVALLVCSLACFWVQSILNSTPRENDKHLWDATTFRRNTRSWTFVYLVLAFVSVSGAFGSWFIFNGSNCRPECVGRDSLSISITALEIFLIVVAVFGLWTVRKLTESSAEKAAEDFMNGEGKQLIQKRADEYADEVFIVRASQVTSGLQTRVDELTERIAAIEEQNPWGDAHQNPLDDDIPNKFD